jgi:predicted nucleic-acid-binding protein
VRDDQPQFERARRLVNREAGSGEPVLISLAVLVETEWVLRSRYGMAKPEILGTFSALLDTADLSFEDEASIARAVYTWKDSAAEFADCLIGARHRSLGCSATATFDAKALTLAGFVAA